MRPIEVRDLRKAYGEVQAVDGVSFEIERGEVFALLGPNGAGKTTVVEIIEGHRTADSGEVRVLGHDPARRERALRERIGIVLQEAGFDEDATVAELVRLHRSLYPRRLDADAVIDLVGLTAKRSARVRTLSGGQKRRLDLRWGSWAIPRCSSSTSPPSASTPRHGVRPGRSSATCVRTARRSCSPRTTSMRRSTWPTAWPWSSPAGWSRPARPAICRARSWDGHRVPDGRADG